MNLKEFLSLYPWEKEYNVNQLNLQNNEKLDFLWNFHLEVKPEDIWDYLADTSTTNKELGLPPMEFKEENGILIGKSKNAGILLEWREVPWQWEYPRFIKNERVYTKGFARYVRAMFLLESENNHTNLSIYFGWIPRNIFGKMILKIGMPKIQKKYQNYLQYLVEQIKYNKFILRKSLIHKKQKEEIFNKIENIYKRINDKGLNLYYKAIWNYLLNQDNNFLYRIKIKKIIKDLNLNFYEVLSFFLKSTKQGLFLLSYDIICPHCKGVRKELNHLGEIPEKESCEVCEIDFESTGFNNIEITFKVHPSIFKVKQEFYCAAEPAKKPHIILQKKIEPKTTYKFFLHFTNDIYRLRWKGQKQYIILKKCQNAKKELIINDYITTDQYIELEDNAQIIIENTSDSIKEIILEYISEDEFFLRPYELFNFQEFRDLFSEEVLNTNIKLDIGIQYLMFIDIVGSTKLYIEKGDDFAFYMVKKFFEVCYEKIKKYYGAVIKTMGDAIFASLPDEESLIQCAKEIWNNFNNKEIKIRIILNSGKVFAVNLNTGIDYFGTPVNLLAKMEKYLKEQEIAIPEHLYKKENIKKYINDLEYLGMENLSLKNDENFMFYIFGNFKIY
ncbi:MAG: adenylate/guanylate cyclase domain-containing protein [Leptospiraceae bacterium]|nr:adenylate/guanylate cyclase domain-containing protein [Leptospiraceae bacterium]